MATRRVVVTGASSGIGEATARRLAADGWEVIGVARRADRLAALAADAGIRTVVADLTSQADVDRLRDELADLGSLHALINNAGGAFGQASVEESDVDDWRRMFEINVLGTKRVITALLPLLRAGAAEPHGDGSPHADIVGITSVAAHAVYPGGGGYHAAKFAESALLQTLRVELGGEPFRVIEVAPGMVKTAEFSLVRYGGDQDRADAVYDGVEYPLSAEDIAATIASALALPGHVNLDRITVTPLAQSAIRTIHKGSLAPKG